MPTQVKRFADRDRPIVKRSPKERDNDSASDDICADMGFPSLIDARQKILKDPDLLIKATNAWHVSTPFYNEKLFDYSGRLPKGYAELTDLLAWWCDASEFSIDPEPLCEFVYWLQENFFTFFIGLEADGRNYWPLHARAVRVLNRMRYAAAAGVGTEPPERIKSPLRGRHPNPDVAKRRGEVRRLEKEGNSPGEIAAKLRTMQQEGKLPKGVPVNVEIVKQDLKRAPKS